MLHHLQHIVDLVEICRLKGIQHVVVSPGSRNAGLIKLFASSSNFKLYSIVDERSAAFYGLGIAIATQEKVAILSTSGTAVLNFGPALCEAFYQRIPLIAITADRPEHLIDQQDNQTIHQQNIYQNYVKQSINLKQPLLNLKEQLEQVDLINKILNIATEGISGPVHINVPIDEPFYIEMPEKADNYKIIAPDSIKQSSFSTLLKKWKQSTRTIILCGKMLPNEKLNNTLNKLAENSSIIILAEPISNIKGKYFFQQLDQLFWRLNSQPNNDLVPDLLISVGGPVVSKHLKLWLQRGSDVEHFRISEAPDQIDTYNNLNENIIANPITLFESLSGTDKINSNYRNSWDHLSTEVLNIQEQFIEKIPFSDLKVYATISSKIPKNIKLHIGNSAPIRYAQLFNLTNANQVYSNRGVSGIDGSVSTAAGYSTINKNLNILLVGDLSFLYDSNALWNKNFPDNLKIIVINNSGGGIFSIIPGPDQQEGYNEFMLAHHPVNLELLVKAFNIDFLECNNQNQLVDTIHQLFNNPKAAILVVNTPQAINADIYKKLIQNLK